MPLSSAAVMGDLAPTAVGKLTCRYGVAAFYTLAFVVGMVAVRGTASEPFILLYHILMSSAVALWIVDDATRRGKPLPHSLHYLVFTLWPLVAFVYLVRSRGLWGVGWWLANALGYVVAGVAGQTAAELISPRW